LYLLDTHVLLWWLGDPVKIGKTTTGILRNPANLVFVSAVSIWEINIKKAAGRLIIPDEFESILKTESRFSELPIRYDHAFQVGKLPPFHMDPFDRMLVAQASLEKLTLLTVDKLIQQYELNWLDPTR
jgi:PIN domain nuclease of toxin-antitoxin system